MASRSVRSEDQRREGPRKNRTAQMTMVCVVSCRPRKLFFPSLCFALHKSVLDRHLHLDRFERSVALQLEIIEREVFNVVHLSLDAQCWERTGRTLQLLLERLHMIHVHVCVAH